jgi:hypothetical protein
MQSYLTDWNRISAAMAALDLRSIPPKDIGEKVLRELRKKRDKNLRQLLPTHWPQQRHPNYRVDDVGRRWSSRFVTEHWRIADAPDRVIEVTPNAAAIYPGAWPRLMRAPLASAYVGEQSVAAFRRSVGKLWPEPFRLPGKGDVWLKDDLDETIDRLTCRPSYVRDAADLL